MGTWNVSETGLNYLMEYSNGFKRSIRRSQVTKTDTSLGIVYASSQSPNLTLAEIVYRIQSYITGISPIIFEPDGSNGWNIYVVANPTNVQIPSGETIDSVHVEVLFWNAGSDTTIHDASVTTDTTINTGANGAGAYEVSLTYNISDGSTFQTFALITTNATNSILKYYKYNGTSVSNVNGLDLTVTADIDTDTTVGVQWAALDGTTPTPIGNGEVADVTVLPNTIRIGTLFDLGSEFPDYPNPDFGVGFSITIN